MDNKTRRDAGLAYVTDEAWAEIVGKALEN